MSCRIAFATVIGLAALIVLGCGPTGSRSGQTGSGAEIIAPATERPAGLDGYLQLPDGVKAIDFPWSQVVVERSSGRLTLGVLVANSGARRTRGLMYWTDLPSNAAMIFIWEDTRARSSGFWNRNVPMDLHVAWLDRDGTILEFATLTAFDEQIKRPQDAYYYALEMPRGRFAELGIAVGDRVLIPETLTSD